MVVLLVVVTIGVVVAVVTEVVLVDGTAAVEHAVATERVEYINTE